jgi:uncharacterized cofD-like protein
MIYFGMNILLIGGGTGSTVVLEGLKKRRDLKLSVIVGMMDDGGSNAVMRDEFGLLPLSDVRKSLLALYDSGNNEVLRKLFLYRFASGEGIKGHTLGNLLMVAMTDILGSEMEAIEMFKTMFGITGEIIPVTLDDVRLVAKYPDGSVIEGEHLIDEPESDMNVSSITLKPSAKATKQALDAIKKADYILFGPGDLFTTTLPNLVVKGIKEELIRSKAKLIYISNLISKKGQTRNRSHSQCVDIITEYIGRDLDYVLINNGKIPQAAYKRYVEKGEHVMKDDLSEENFSGEIIRKDLVATEPIKREKGDTLERSLVRHDSDKLTDVLYDIFVSKRGPLLKWLNKLLSYYKD